MRLTLGSAGSGRAVEGAAQSRSGYPALFTLYSLRLGVSGLGGEAAWVKGQQVALVRLRRAEGAASLSGASVL